MRRENDGHFLVGTVILGFLSITTKGQTSSPFEALNSPQLSKCKMDMRPRVRIGGDLGLFQGSTQGIHTSIDLVR